MLVMMLSFLLWYRSLSYSWRRPGTERTVAFFSLASTELACVVEPCSASSSSSEIGYASPRRFQDADRVVSAHPGASDVVLDVAKAAAMRGCPATLAPFLPRFGAAELLSFCAGPAAADGAGACAAVAGRDARGRNSGARAGAGASARASAARLPRFGRGSSGISSPSDESAIGAARASPPARGVREPAAGGLNI